MTSCFHRHLELLPSLIPSPNRLYPQRSALHAKHLSFATHSFSGVVSTPNALDEPRELIHRPFGRKSISRLSATVLRLKSSRSPLEEELSTNNKAFFTWIKHKTGVLEPSTGRIKTRSNSFCLASFLARTTLQKDWITTAARFRR